MSDTMSRTLSVCQEHELLLALEKAGLVSDEAQAVISSKKNQLAKGMVGWLREQLALPASRRELVFNHFTPVNELVEKIMARSELRGWGFTDEHAEQLCQQLAGRDHAGPLVPVGITIWREGNLAHNWAESLAWWNDEMKAIGLEPVDYLSELEPKLYPNRESSLRPMLEACDLDFQAFWNPQDGVVPRDVRNAHPMRKWPALEVIDLLALNPHYAALMNGDDIPFLMAAGLVVRSGYVPSFYRGDRRVYASYGWDGNRWRRAALVAFRES